MLAASVVLLGLPLVGCVKHQLRVRSDQPVLIGDVLSVRATT